MTTAPAKAPEKTTYRNFVGGEWVASESTKSTPNLNPADTRDVLGHIPLSSADETRRAADAAKAAFPAWRDTPAPVRGAILFRAQAILDKEKDELARLLTREEGKTVKEALGEIQRSINILEYIAAEGRRIGGHTVPSELPHNFCYTVRQPVGVVACITPWNFPVAIPIWKIAPALVSGNTVVFKPASLTPATATAVVSIFERAGVPKGVLNMVLGSGSTVGNALLDHEAVHAVSFTGSNEVGAEIYARGARRMIRVQAEMGGKNPVVVLADADLDLAVEATAQGAFGSTGQRCTATSRVIVEESIADRFVERLVARAGKVRVGSGLDASTDMGPAVDKAQLDTDLEYIGIGKGERAALACGGRQLSDGALAHGHFVEPTVFDHVKMSMRIAQEEIFGPVIAVVRVKDFDEAMTAANDVRFGLSSSIFTTDATTVFRFADRIEAGIVHINSGTPGGEAQLPFGGMKGTGVGPREQGSTAIEFFTEIKTVYVDYTGQSREELGVLKAPLALAVALLAGHPAGAQDTPAVRTALVTFADGNTLPLRNWTLSYDYVTWAKGRSPASGVQAGREANDLWLGKRVVPVTDAVLAIQHGELRRETLVDGRPQSILSSSAREVTITTPDAKAVKVKVEPPHRELLAPDADKSTMVMARSLDLRGEGITGTRREVCLLSFTSLVECGGTPADQVVKVQFQP